MKKSISEFRIFLWGHGIDSIISVVRESGFNINVNDLRKQIEKIRKKRCRCIVCCILEDDSDIKNWKMGLYYDSNAIKSESTERILQNILFILKNFR